MAHVRISALIAAAALAFSAPTLATVVGGAETGGTAFNNGGVFMIVAPFAQVGNNRQQDNNLYAWNEVQDFTLGTNLAVDIGGPFILAGTRVASHGIVFDPTSSRTLRGYVGFDRKILAVITRRDTLMASDFLNGGVTAFDNPIARGLEINDHNNTSFLGNMLTIDWTASAPGDNIRVITSYVPEPASWALMIAGFGMIGLAARRRARATA